MAGAGWYRGGTPFLRPAGRPGLSPIVDGCLLVGEYPTPDDVRWLRDEHGVTAVVCLQDDADLVAKNLELRDLEGAYRRHGVAFHHHPVRDGDVDGLAARLPEIVELLHTLVGAGGRVYLHCNAGFNRAPTVAIAYLHVHGELSLPEALQAVKQRRSCVPYRRALDLCFPPPPGETP